MNSFSIKALQNSFNIRSLLDIKFLPNVTSSRNTFILKRRYPVKLSKVKVDTLKRLKGKDYVYDLVEFQENKKKPPIPVVLKDIVEGIGQKGDFVELPRNFAYNKLIVTGLADFATPEAIEQAKLSSEKEGSETNLSSPFVPRTIRILESLKLAVVMNLENEWTIEPWHIHVSFRKAGIHVPVECIQIPEKPIKGPDEDLQSKVFFVTVTINKREKATVQCKIHHWSTNPGERLPWVDKFWELPAEAVFPEDAEKVKSLNVKSQKNIETDIEL